MTDISAIGVFCGSKMGTDPRYRDAALRLGRAIASRGWRLVYGGGGIGLMGAMAQAALDAGGKVTGVIPRFLAEYELGDLDLDELIVVESMHERKKTMFAKADAFVILPGGLGSLDEAFEIITWKQLHLHAKPIVVVNVIGFWRPLSDLIGHCINNGFAHQAAAELFTMVDEVDQVFEAIKKSKKPKIETLTDHF